MQRAERRPRRSAWHWRRCARRACRSSSSKRLRWTAAVKASWSTRGWASRTCVDCSRTKTTCQWIRSGPWSSICPISSWVSLLSSIRRPLIASDATVLLRRTIFIRIFNAEILTLNRCSLELETPLLHYVLLLLLKTMWNKYISYIIFKLYLMTRSVVTSNGGNNT